jgi:class 3 adenylate cyclase
MSDLPSGAVTFLFTDIEGSTRLVRRLRGRYADALAEHQRLLRQAFEAQGGHEIDTQGDAFFYAFARAHEAVLAAIAGQRALLGYPWPDDAPVKVRMGIHTGQSTPVNGRYTGLAVHRAARICAAGHGGQVVVSQATQSLLEDEEEDLAVRLQDLGEQRLKDIERPVRLYQVAAAGLPAEFPPLRQDAEADVPVGTRRRWTRRSRLLLALGAGVLLAAIAASVVLPRGGEDPVVIRSNSLVAIDAASNEPVASVPLRPGAGAVAVGEGAVWVGNARERTLSRVDPARKEVTSEIGLALGPEAIAVGEEGVWAAEAHQSKPELSYATLARVDPRANEERLTVRITPPNPLGAGEEPVLAAGEGGCG